MTLDAQRLISLPIAPQTRALESRDLILYALSVGLGAAEAERGFAYERALRAVPTVATVLAYDDGWLEPAGVPLPQVFHAAQRLDFHRPLPVEGRYTAANRIAGVADKGAGKAALILQQASLTREGEAEPFATGLSTLFVRGGGGGGSAGMAPPLAAAIPERAPDAHIPIATRPEQPLLFRLLGDLNPLHVDPEAARAAGFERPILHGACTFGIACAALLRAVCELEPDRLARIEARFAAPAFPGEALMMALWHDGDSVAFRLSAPGRGAVILDAGSAGLRAV